MKHLPFGYFIAIEGIDQSGKETQTLRLAKALEESGYEVLTLSFPDYSTITGTKIREFLNGYSEWDNTLYQTLAVVNRYEQQTRIQEALMAGKIIISDRYSDSSIAYGLADGCDPQWLVSINQSLVQPDCVVFIDISVEEAFRRKQTERDVYESNKEFLEDVRAIYKQASTVLNWVEVNGTQTPDEIHTEVYTQIVKKLGEQRHEN